MPFWIWPYLIPFLIYLYYRSVAVAGALFDFDVSERAHRIGKAENKTGLWFAPIWGLGFIMMILYFTGY